MDNKKQIRRAARCVIVDESTNKIALLEVGGGKYHKIPGGAVENNESLEETALREAIEEGASDVELIAKLGEIEFYSPKCGGQIHHSVCFLARRTNKHKTTSFTEEETKNKFKLLWISFDEAISLLENVKSKIQFERNMNNRDLKFVKKAREYLATNKK